MSGLRIAALSLLLLLAACSGQGRLQADDPRLQRASTGVMLFDGKPYTGVIEKRDATGALLAERPYAEGRLHGVEREWHANGQRSSERPYEHGRKAGHHQAWWADGKRRFDYTFVDGHTQGVSRGWFPNGQLSEQREYINGRESGSQRSWFADGRVRANYFVKDGRRYGSIGVKLCLTTEERAHALKAAKS